MSPVCVSAMAYNRGLRDMPEIKIYPALVYRLLLEYCIKKQVREDLGYYVH